MSSHGGLPAIGRRALAAVVALVLVGGVLVVFSGTLTRSTDAEAAEAQARAERDRMAAEVAAGRLELDYVRSDDFIEWQARAYGLGDGADERLFRLPEDAPTPAPIVPIGPLEDTDPPRAPFDAWMDLLFGA